MMKLKEEEREKIVKALKEEYPKGRRVELISMSDEYTNIPKGTKGTVRSVDDMGTVHINWDTGSSLGAVYNEDKIKALPYLKNIMMEDEMEHYLREHGYKIDIGEKGEEILDSTLVSEYVVDLGYSVEMDETTQINAFTLSNRCNWCDECFDKEELEKTQIGLLCWKCRKALKSRGENI